MQPSELVDLVESATATDELIVGDAQLLAEAAVRGDGTVPVRLITPGWGSSGYYPAAVLERDGPTVFGPGLKMFWDHPTVTEAAERPERSLRDLAGELVTKARWVADHPDGPGLYAEAKVFSPFRESLDQLAPHIGVSIRASGVAVHGEAEGRTGPIVEKILSAASVDFVTEAGRGGKILELFEATRRSAERVRLQEGHGEFSAEEVRELLRSALRAGMTTENRWLWVRDFGDDWVVYEDEGQGAPDPGYYRRAYSISDAGEVALGSAVKVAPHTEWLPVVQQPVVESKETNVPPTPAELQESVTALQQQVATLTEAHRQLEAERDQAKTEAARATGALLVVEADKVVDDELATKAKELPEPTRARLAETLKGKAPVTDDGTLDRAAIVTAVEEAVKAEADYLAKVTGRGQVTGMGSASGTAGDISAEEADRKLEAAFAGLGMTESAAKIAAQGRG